MPPPLIARLLLDALDEFGRAIEHVPPPGRDGPIGRLNAAGWTIAHAAVYHDYWINVDCAGAGRDPWLVEWSEAQGALPPGDALPTGYGDAAEALGRVAERATVYLEERAEAGEDEVIREFDGSAWEGRTKGYLVARAAAHLFAHAGELSVAASLVLSEDRDLGLPGRLARSTGTGSEAVAPSGARPPIVRMLLDAREELARVADATPVPAQTGAFARLNSGGRIVAHLAQQDDRYWNVSAQRLAPDAWLEAARAGDAASQPPFDEARAALDRSYARSRPYLVALDGAELDTVVLPSRRPGRPDQTVSDLLVRQTAHYFATAGELAAIASLAGAPDPGLPGAMAHTAGGA